MKGLIRKLFMWAFFDELIEVKEYVFRDPSGLEATDGLSMCGEIKGALFILDKLDLLA